MATTASVARNLLKNRSLPNILRSQIIGRSNVAANISNIVKDHQIAQSLFVSNQNIHAQIPLFHFSQTGSLFGSSLMEKGVGHGMNDFDIKARGSDVEEDDDSDNEFDDDDDFDGELIDDDDGFDDDDDEDDDDEEEDDGDEGKFEGSKYKNKL